MVEQKIFIKYQVYLATSLAMVDRTKRSILLARVCFFLFWVSELVKSSQIQYNSLYVQDESDAEKGFHNKLASASFDNLFQKGNLITIRQFSC
jgi:hypothetical protein